MYVYIYMFFVDKYWTNYAYIESVDKLTHSRYCLPDPLQAMVWSSSDILLTWVLVTSVGVIGIAFLRNGLGNFGCKMLVISHSSMCYWEIVLFQIKKYNLLISKTLGYNELINTIEWVGI